METTKGKATRDIRRIIERQVDQVVLEIQDFPPNDVFGRFNAVNDPSHSPKLTIDSALEQTITRVQ